MLQFLLLLTLYTLVDVVGKILALLMILKMHFSKTMFYILKYTKNTLQTILQKYFTYKKNSLSITKTINL